MDQTFETRAPRPADQGGSPMQTMHKLVEGYIRFRSTVFPRKFAHYDRLGAGRNPDHLLITCSDSRVLPHEFTDATEGDLFEERSLGNIVPTPESGEIEALAVVEYAVVMLQVRHLVVCGHTDCGAMKGLLDPDLIREMPTVAAWLANAQETLEVVRRKHPHLQGDELLDAAVHENVLVQLNRLRRLPFVHKRLASGALYLHGWVFEIEKGRVVEYDPRVGQYVPLPEAYRPTGG
jgi:carbonic anhydrase